MAGGGGEGAGSQLADDSRPIHYHAEVEVLYLEERIFRGKNTFSLCLCFQLAISVFYTPSFVLPIKHVLRPGKYVLRMKNMYVK